MNEREQAVIPECLVCGNTFEGLTPDKCPICGTPKEKFMKIK
jgi:rubrerythrin